MKTYNNKEQVLKDVVNWVLKVSDNITFTFDLKMSIDIDAYSIKAIDIDVNNIYSDNIEAHNISANNISAYNIRATKINAINITYYAICITYEILRCNSIQGRRENSKHFCLDKEVEIIWK